MRRRNSPHSPAVGHRQNSAVGGRRFMNIGSSASTLHSDGVAETMARKTLFPSLNPVLAKLLSLDKVRDVYELSRELDGTNIFNRILKHMNVVCAVSDADLSRVPSTGPCVVVANHPFGILDGILLGDLLLRVRPDLKILTNYMLTGVPELDEYCIPLDPFEKKQSAISDRHSAVATAAPARGRAAVPSESESGCSNQRGLRGGKDWLKRGGVLLIFPAGEVAHLNPKQWTKGVTDPEWNTTAFRLARLTGASALPVFIDGRNSASFQLMGCVHPRLRTARLPKEFLRKRGAKVEVRIGTKISTVRGSEWVKDRSTSLRTCKTKTQDPSTPVSRAGESAREPSSAQDAKLGGISSAKEGTEFLRWKTYLLANRASKVCANASKPASEDPKTAQIPFLPAAKLPLIPFLGAPEELAEAVPAAQLEHEIAFLPPSACLDDSQDY